MSDDKFELSRRNALIGLGTVGAASAGAGIGTSAFYNDQSEMQNNTITAGQFSMTVNSHVETVNQDGIGDDEDTYFDSNGDSVWAGDSIVIKDAKPGDEYKFCWDITILDNPGYVSVASDYTNQTGAEANDLNSSDVFNVSSNGDFTTLAAVANNLEVTLDNNTTTSSSNDPDYTYSYSSLSGLLSDLKDGTILTDDNGDPIEFQPSETWTLCVAFDIPERTGNDLQGAELNWNMVIYAEQARHNSASNVKNGSVDAVTQL